MATSLQNLKLGVRMLEEGKIGGGGQTCGHSGKSGGNNDGKMVEE
jgi:hypothetical protein